MTNIQAFDSRTELECSATGCSKDGLYRDLLTWLLSLTTHSRTHSIHDMALKPEALTPHSKRVLELLLEGRVDDARRFIDDKFTRLIIDLQKQMDAVDRERNILLSTLQLAMRANELAAHSATSAPTGRPLTKDERREQIMKHALNLARKNDGLVRVQDVVNNIAHNKIDLGTGKPNTSVGNTLFKSKEWRREAPAVFRYVGPQLDLVGRAS